MTEGDPEALADLDPETAEPADIPIDALAAGLQSGDNLTRTHAATLLGVVSVEEPESIEDLVPLLVESLDDERTVVVRESLGALWDLATVDPTPLAGQLGPIVEQLCADLPLLRIQAGRIIDIVIPDHADWLSPHVEGLIAAATQTVEDPVEGSDPTEFRTRTSQDVDANRKRTQEARQIGARIVAARALAIVAESDPDAVVPHAPALIELLRADSGGVKTAAVIAVAELAEDYPEALSDAVEPLCEILPETDTTIAAKAITGLGFIGDPSAEASLRELAAEDDREEELRDLARETAAWLVDD